MDNREAKFVLNAYRPGGQDASDPRFAKALEQTRCDPVLERWFVDSIAFDTAMTEKLRTIELPPDLRESILAGAKVSRPLRWIKPLAQWGIAAALISMAILGSLIWRNARPAHPAGWQNEALVVISSLVRNESKFDAQSRNTAELLAWLRANHAPTAQKLPDGLDKLASIGCKTFFWDNKRLSVICFTRRDGGLIHLVMRSAAGEAGRGRKGKLELIQRGEWATAIWRDGGTLYMLALEGSREELRTYLL
jgi:hypothetical protein